MRYLQSRARDVASYFIIAAGALLFTCPSRASDLASIKAQVITQASTKFGMDAHDLQQQQLSVTPVQQSNGETSYHVVGQFTLGWLHPRNPDEVAQIYANQNRCMFAGADCQPGIQHTIYVDVTATQGQSSSQMSIIGNESKDRTIEESREVSVDDLSASDPNLLKEIASLNPPSCEPIVVARYTSNPLYPPQAITQRHAGTTVVQLLLSSDGSVRGVSVYGSSGYRELDRSAIEAASHWSYAPIVCKGTNKPALAAIRVPLNFGLQKKPH